MNIIKPKTKIILKKIIRWAKNINLATGRLINALCAGDPNETIIHRLIKLIPR